MAQVEMFAAKANSPATELTAAITDVATTVSVLDASKLPDAPNIATIGVDESAETVRYEGKSGNDLTGVTRGFSGTGAKAWTTGVGVARYFTAYDADALRENVAEHSAELVSVNAQLAETKSQLKDIELNVKTFGAIENTDSTAAIQAALNAGLKVKIPSGTYLINGLTPLVPRNNSKIFLDDDTVLKVMPNDSPGYQVFLIRNKKNIEINGGTIQGDRYVHTPSGGLDEGGHGIQIQSSSNIKVSNLKTHEFWGDGIYIGSTVVDGVDTTSKHIKFENVVSDSNRRQGLSLVGVEDSIFTNCVFTNTSGTAPQAGIDLEPNDSINSPNRRVTFISCKSSGNVGPAMLAVGDNYDINAYDCDFESTFTSKSLWFPGKGKNNFTVCRFKGATINIRNTTFVNCDFLITDEYADLYAINDGNDFPNTYIDCLVTAVNRRFLTFNGATTEKNRKVMTNCRFEMTGNGAGDRNPAALFGGYYTLDRCRFTHSGDVPATGFQLGLDANGTSRRVIASYFDTIFNYFYNTQGTITVDQPGYRTNITTVPAFVGQLSIVGNSVYTAIGTSSVADWVRSGRYVTVPASASATGSVGDWAADASYLYVCYATNTWRRVAVATW
ncbi:right-handed parallel beta-helix repeat-containing protein [Paenibacillus odorifer]|uniref:right-handed parallel beta-helix repeat-containing protein n=1 Tax=Paenibacillus TaxID=44249 RepID=UPI00096F5E77|nr:right-handed parallel beta-helix repeat-containing protein [Paenibacillus odorifer]OMC93789.1 hypothetical protein BJP46_30925 [Paenibacillus odorifer]